VVFVGKDECGVPRYAHSKSTNKDSKVRFDVAGSDKKYAFNYINEDSGIVLVFESAIDMLSFISFSPTDWHKLSYISLGGLSSTPLLHFLEKNSKINSVELCLDNDGAGWAMQNKLTELLTQMGYSVTTASGLLKKDWNEELLEWRGKQKQTNIKEISI